MMMTMIMMSARVADPKIMAKNFSLNTSNLVLVAAVVSSGGKNTKTFSLVNHTKDQSMSELNTHSQYMYMHNSVFSIL